MNGNTAAPDQNHITLGSDLSDMKRLPQWVGSLASQYQISGKLKFSIELCLEEVVSNIIRHGYQDEAGRSLDIHFHQPHPGRFIFVIDDYTPHFNPLEAPPPPPLDPDSPHVGGQGIRLLREFANTLEYEPTPTGNRLRIGFSS